MASKESVLGQAVRDLVLRMFGGSSEELAMSLVKTAGRDFRASTPTGEVTIFDAIHKQPGIKLQKQKHPMPVMVIVHVEHPTEN